MDIIFSDFIASLISFTLKSRITLHARFCNLNILSLFDSEELPNLVHCTYTKSFRDLIKKLVKNFEKITSH